VVSRCCISSVGSTVGAGTRKAGPFSSLVGPELPFESTFVTPPSWDMTVSCGRADGVRVAVISQVPSRNRSPMILHLLSKSSVALDVYTKRLKNNASTRLRRRLSSVRGQYGKSRPISRAARRQQNATHDASCHHITESARCWVLVKQNDRNGRHKSDLL
jgi:hypothetical protein